MDASRRGELLYKLADLMERDAVNYLLFHYVFYFPPVSSLSSGYSGVLLSS